MWIIFFVIFIDALGFGLIIPTLPYIATKIGANAITIGFLMSTYPFFQFFGSPVLGRLSDRYGRKPILILSLIGGSISYGLIVLSQSIAMFFLSRSVAGLTGGSISVAQAYITDMTEGKKRTHAIGLMGAAFGMGFIVGPLIGGLLTSYGLTMPFLFAGFLALTNAILIIILIPEPTHHIIIKPQKPWTFSVIRETLQPPIVAQLTILLFFVMLSVSLLQGIFPVFANNVFKWDARGVGIFFAYLGLMLVASQGVLLRTLLKFIDEKHIIQISLFTLAFGFLFIHVEGSVYIAATILALSFGLLTSTLQAEISSLASPHEQGAVLGLAQGGTALAQTIGPALGGYLLGKLFLQAPFYFSFYLLFICAIVSIFIFRKHSKG